MDGSRQTTIPSDWNSFCQLPCSTGSIYYHKPSTKEGFLWLQLLNWTWDWKLQLKDGHIPTLRESDFSPFTAGWLLMVRKPWLLIFTNLSLICTVSGCNPSASDQGFVLSSPAQYLANICNKHSISTWQKHLNRMPFCLHSSCNSF